MIQGSKKGITSPNERIENLKKRLEIESLKGLHHNAIYESENESESGDTPVFADRTIFEKLERNFQQTDFFLGNDDDFMSK
jgi:hypothetical protein